MKRAYEDPTTKERNFTTPVALSAAHRSLGPPAGKDTQRSRTPAGSGRGAKGKASGTKAKGHGRSTGKGSDGDVCFRYNEKEKKCSLKHCKFKHVCWTCGGKHPAYECRGHGQAPAGEASTAAGS